MLIATKGANSCNSSVLVAATTRPLTVMSPSMPSGSTARRNSAQKPMMQERSNWDCRLVRAIANSMAALDQVAFARRRKPKAFSRVAIRVCDTAGSAAAESDLAAIIHRTIGKEPSDIGTDHNGCDHKRNLGLPIHGALVVSAASRFERSLDKSGAGTAPGTSANCLALFGSDLILF
jgi:hypothetical protein